MAIFCPILVANQVTVLIGQYVVHVCKQRERGCKPRERDCRRRNNSQIYGLMSVSGAKGVLEAD